MTASHWKRFYRTERETRGAAGLEDLFERAPRIAVPPTGAIVFPHTRLSATGEVVASAVRAVVESGRETVLAIGVLHGGRERDADQVGRARAGDASALAQLRGIHGPDAPCDHGIWSEEFSLDNFIAMISLAARKLGCKPPRVVARFPFLVGSDPGTLPGIDELGSLLARGAALVATTDPIHHGIGYGTPVHECLTRTDPATLQTARGCIDEGFSRLARHDFSGFLVHANSIKSDFRDAGPVLATLLGNPCRFQVLDLRLVDYSDVLNCDEPTWVAAALTRFDRVKPAGNI